jgi:hypothetical protein
MKSVPRADILSQHDVVKPDFLPSSAQLRDMRISRSKKIIYQLVIGLPNIGVVTVSHLHMHIVFLLRSICPTFARRHRFTP